MHTGFKVSKFIHKIIMKKNIPKSKLFICSFWNNNMAYGIACFKKKNRDVIGATRAHRWDIFFKGNKGSYLPMRKPIFEELDSIFFSSKEGKSYFSEKLKIQSDKLKIGWLGIKKSGFMNPKPRHNPLEILTCSAMISRKRNHLMIEALSKIDDIKINWKHIGDGPNMKKLIEMGDNFLSPKKNIEHQFLGRFSNPELYNYYKNNPIDIFINLSTSEGIPMAIVEVMSFYIPVIATNVGGISEIINNKNGVLLTSNPSIDEIINAILKISNINNEEYSNKQKKAFETWQNRFDAETTYTKFAEDLYNLKKT